ncbi:MAG: 50S ribosomal protein L25/general stress protein Ctc [Neisseriaceae bacterium]|nr:MAG: 50S ribosomal protein L25/general stress protein Ctc [Neisseriaceae bacterium]
MTEVVKANKRDKIGTGASRRLRRQGLIPAIIYGDNQQPINISVDQNKMFHALNQPEFHTSVVQLELEGQPLEVIVRSFQMHPFKPQVQHIDFQRINSEKTIKIKVPLEFLNAESSVAVKLHGGAIFKIANSVEIITKPTTIPQKLTIDLKDILPGQILHVSDIKFPEGVESAALKCGNNPPIVSSSGKSK